MTAPSVCVVLNGADPSASTTLDDVQRYGFDEAILVDAARPDRSRPGLKVAALSSVRLITELLVRLDHPGDTAMLVTAGRGLERFNWLDLVPRLASRPRSGAAVAFLSDEPGTAVAALIKRGAVEALRHSHLLAGLADNPDTVAVRYDAADAAPCEPRPAVFFDRDGVINADHGYVGDASRFVFLPDAIAGVKAANDGGALAFLVTNQSGVARGYYTEQDVVDLHRHMAREMRRHGAHFDDIRMCPHLPDGAVAAYRQVCRCRKPEPGMLLDIMRHWPVERTRSVMIGDKASDLEAARAAGLTGMLYRGGQLADLVTASLERDGRATPASCDTSADTGDPKQH